LPDRCKPDFCLLDYFLPDCFPMNRIYPLSFLVLLSASAIGQESASRLRTVELSETFHGDGAGDVAAAAVADIDGDSQRDFRSAVRDTEPLSPEEERSTFVLPEGFEAQLVAAEPDIAKPMNMAFDLQGRLWVTDSVEYPYPAPADREGRDSIKILEDTDGDGRADKITTFADKLNIPIGLYPYGDGVICFSIPNIYYLRDTDGDGRADQREILYGPFDTTRDAHGMCNAFTRGYDGWLYACHGFNNQSSVAGRDGNVVTLQSGNTFRMRLDGSRIEHFTHGQVNPFGMATDPAGDLFTADCHTKPVSLLLRGGHYEGFGRPHDGLGFVPPVMQHLHGSTAIAGLALYHADLFPDDYRGNSFGGNVMTSRINRNSIHHAGASVRVQEEPDFLMSGDPWFRPVDLKVGPDGALYVADFYNRIIGHYEVPLDHPGRDRHRGRIWRITYNPNDNARDEGEGLQGKARPSASESIDLTKGIDTAIAALKSDNLTLRMLATDALVDQFGQSSIETIREHLPAARNEEKVHLLWAMKRLGGLRKQDLQSAHTDSDPLVRVHAQRLIGSVGKNSSELDRALLLSGLSDTDPRVRRAAAMATCEHRSPEFIEPLMQALQECAPEDVHLRHAIRIALRDHWMNPEWFAMSVKTLDDTKRKQVVDLCLAIRTEFAGDFVAENMATLAGLPRERLSEYLTFAGRYASPAALQSVCEVAEQRFTDDFAYQEELLRSIRAGLLQRGVQMPPVVHQWAHRLARQYLGLSEYENNLPATTETIGWTHIADLSQTNSANPWVISTTRNSSDGQNASLLYSSFPEGELLTGTFRSGSFQLPAEFHCYVAGHDGSPDQPMQNRNFIQIRDAKTHAVIKRWSPPRNDTAQPIRWNAGDASGRQVYVELVDGDTANAYAWLAVGRFSVDELNPNDSALDRRKAASLVADFRLTQLAEPISQWMTDPGMSRGDSSEFAKAFVTLKPSPCGPAIAAALTIAGVNSELRADLLDLLTSEAEYSIAEIIGRAMQVATASEQQRIAELLSSDRDGLAVFLTIIEAGHASPRLLANSSTVAKAMSLASQEQSRRIQHITDNLPNEDAALLVAMTQRKHAYLTSSGDPTAGIEIFRTQCANCHKVAGKGAEVGPNLDGIGNRGLDRLLEDVMIPSRNIDAAFRASLVLTEDGRIVSGVIKRTDGTQLIIVDQKGSEIAIPLDSIEEQKTTSNSPMPANFHETLDNAKMNDLLAYLLSLTT
jgi:putative heme-binding domain-containing protein